jgi:hypothetical protein
MGFHTKYKLLKYLFVHLFLLSILLSHLFGLVLRRAHLLVPVLTQPFYLCDMLFLSFGPSCHHQCLSSNFFLR